MSSQSQPRQVKGPWQEKHRPFVPIKTARQYRRAAIGVLRGAAICHAEIEDLRHLIDTVQRAAKKARLILQDVNITIHGGTIERCQCDEIDISVTLALSAHFVAEASFHSAHFAAQANFSSAYFAGWTDFGSAHFAGETGFYSAHFARRAYFASAHFAGFESFHSAHFAGEAYFSGAHFAGWAGFGSVHFSKTAYFRFAHFAGEASFSEAHFAGEADFSRVTISRTFKFTALNKVPETLNLINIKIRPGAAIELDLDHLRCEDHSAQNPDNEPWMVERDALSSRIALLDKQSMLRWTLECFDVALWMRHPVRHAFGLGKRGDVIDGETSDKPEELRSAAAQYNILRNSFRTQPSTEQHEDLCHFRYKELMRRAAWRDRPALWKRVKLSLEWLVMRNMLGYMIYPIRIATTATMFLIIATLIFGLFAGPGTITHNIAKTPDEAMQIWQSDPLNPLYFSLMTFVTLGYGDFAPLGWFKMVCGLEGFLGVALLALFTVAWGRKMIR